jgi:hypothetical protein
LLSVLKLAVIRGSHEPGAVCAPSGALSAHITKDDLEPFLRELVFLPDLRTQRKCDGSIDLVGFGYRVRAVFAALDDALNDSPILGLLRRTRHALISLLFGREPTTFITSSVLSKNSIIA